MATRTQQKARTRQVILDAVARLLDAGTTAPTVDDIVVAANISRATFYRYFPSPAEALWHVVVDQWIPPTDDLLMGADDVGERVRRVEDTINGYLLGVANATRAFERAMLDRTLSGQDLPEDRPARRLAYIDAALEPIADDLDPEDLFLVRHALALTMGSSVVPALLDTCGLDATRARVVTAFAAQAIVNEARRRAAPDRPDRTETSQKVE
jgi:AcrR family transcriptional regulator